MELIELLWVQLLDTSMCVQLNGRFNEGLVGYIQASFQLRVYSNLFVGLHSTEPKLCFIYTNIKADDAKNIVHQILT